MGGSSCVPMKVQKYREEMCVLRTFQIFCGEQSLRFHLDPHLPLPPLIPPNLTKPHRTREKMSRKSSKKSDILEKQSNSKQKTKEIAGIVEQLRGKPDWITKISDPIIREKYCQEAVDQGISLENIEKAFSILETMAQCQPPRAHFSLSSDEIDDVEVVIQVGGTNFTTTTRVLTADSESMLNRMFSPPWLQPQNGQPISIETTSNSPVIFDHILKYLTALKNNDTNLCPAIHSLSFEELDLLRQDCDYLVLRRFIIALDVQMMSQEMLNAEDQKLAAKKLFNIQRELISARDEKVRLMKRLEELPAQIVQLENEEKEAEQERLRFISRWQGQPGDKVMINTSGQRWEECILGQIDGQLVAEMPSKKRIYSSNAQPLSIPLPSPAFYHPVVSTPHCSGSAWYYDNFLPEILSQSIEQHLDALLHRSSLDLHPGSDGQVVDLIHPSLFPYIKGLTQVSDENELSLCAKVETDYSWLPSEFHVNENGAVTIGSYINNLDQNQFPELYFDIAQTFQTILPLFETTLSKSLRSSVLQVIVKAAYYFIPPGETYEGSWHVEGMPHEHILANAIYYITSSENIDNNYLEFRELLPEESFYDNHGRAGEEVSLIEDLGSVNTPTGRIIVWENNIQHKVGPLTVPLSDSSKKQKKKSKRDESSTPSAPASVPPSGIRKILCFFLVDPSERVVSTKIVPEQQNLIPWNVALEHRQCLMNERKYFARDNAEDWESRTYTFCEH